MTMDAIIMMIITLVGYIGSFSYFMIRVFKKEKSKAVRKISSRIDVGIYMDLGGYFYGNFEI